MIIICIHTYYKYSNAASIDCTSPRIPMPFGSGTSEWCAKHMNSRQGTQVLCFSIKSPLVLPEAGWRAVGSRSKMIFFWLKRIGAFQGLWPQIFSDASRPKSRGYPIPFWNLNSEERQKQMKAPKQFNWWLLIHDDLISSHTMPWRSLWVFMVL